MNTNISVIKEGKKILVTIFSYVNMLVLHWQTSGQGKAFAVKNKVDTL